MRSPDELDEGPDALVLRAVAEAAELAAALHEGAELGGSRRCEAVASPGRGLGPVVQRLLMEEGLVLVRAQALDEFARPGGLVPRRLRLPACPEQGPGVDVGLDASRWDGGRQVLEAVEDPLGPPQVVVRREEEEELGDEGGGDAGGDGRGGGEAEEDGGGGGGFGGEEEDEEDGGDVQLAGATVVELEAAKTVQNIFSLIREWLSDGCLVIQ